MNIKHETRPCVVCGADFDARILVKDGAEVPSDYGQKCPACRKAERDAEEHSQDEADLVIAVKEQRDQWQRDCGLPAKFRGKTFANFKRQLQPKAYAAMKGYTQGQSIVLLSPGVYGIGKTHLAAALVNAIIETCQPAQIGQCNAIVRNPCPVLFVTANDIIARIRSSFDHTEGDETEAHIYRRLEAVPLLIIDDVGKVRPRDPSFLQGVYFRIIDYRYTNEKDLVITTNLSAVELEEHIGAPSADRLVEMVGKGGFIKMTGKSYRGAGAK